jgi:hypothetical protein
MAGGVVGHAGARLLADGTRLTSAFSDASPRCGSGSPDMTRVESRGQATCRGPDSAAPLSGTDGWKASCIIRPPDCRVAGLLRGDGKGGDIPAPRPEIFIHGGRCDAVPAVAEQ